LGSIIKLSYLILRFSQPSVSVTLAFRVHVYWILRLFQHFSIHGSPHLLGKCEAEKRRYIDPLVGVGWGWSMVLSNEKWPYGLEGLEEKK
jgi:hypothetical protein